MRQLPLFIQEELSEVRDGTVSRNYYPARDEFRRERARRREWSLIHRMPSDHAASAAT
ncbi:hypothetical protein [Actinoplanes sp. NPDC026623]|uniref:hypothetical protein n=1 Tax=Actinoplanes sp. NPDC026623 TaxID=3155610 RepID=UPI0033D27C2B